MGLRRSLPRSWPASSTTCRFQVERVHICVEGPGEEVEFTEEDDVADDNDRHSDNDSSTSHSSRQPSAEHSQHSASGRSDHSASASGSATPSTPFDPSLSPSVLVSHSPSSSHPHYTFGLVLQSLSIETTDAEGVPSFVKSSGSVVYKRVEVGGLGVYWQSNADRQEKATRRYVDADDVDAFDEFMSAPFVGRRSPAPAASARSADSSFEGEEEGGADASTASSSTASLSPPALSYLLRPTDASVHLQLSKAASGGLASNETKKQPRVTATLHLGAVELELNAAQFRSMKSVAAQLSAALPPDVSVHLRHAPFVSPAADPVQQATARQWWQFAIGVHRRRIHERLKERRWQSVVRARRDYNAYVPLYRSKLLTVRDGRNEEAYRAEQRKDIESRWSVRTILAWRALIEQQTRISVALTAVKQKNLQTSQRSQPRSLLYTPIATGATVAGWVGSFFYAPAGAGAAESEERMPEMSVSEREQLQSVLGFDPLGPIEQLISADKDAPLYYIKLDVDEVAVTIYQATLTSHTQNDLASPEPRPQPARERASSLARARMDLAVLRVQSMSAAAFIQASETSVQLEVGGLHVEDCMQKDSPHLRYLVTSSLRNAPHIAQVKDQHPAAHVTFDGSTPRSAPSPSSSASSSSSTALIKVQYRHQEHVAGVQDEDGVNGAVSSQGVFTRTLSVPVLPSHLLSASDVLELELNTLHVNWNRTTISLIVDFLNQQEEVEGEEEEEVDEQEELADHLEGQPQRSSTDEKESKDESGVEEEREKAKREKQARLNRRRTLPARGAAASLPSPSEQPLLISSHLRNRSTPLPLPGSPSPLAACRPSVVPPSTPVQVARSTSGADPRSLLRILKRKLANVSRYRKARDAAEIDTVELKRGGKTLSRLRLNPQRQRQLEEQQLAREESASVPLALPGAGGDGKGEVRYSVVRVNASLNSFSISLNDDVADVTLVHAEINGLNVSVEQSRPDQDDGSAADEVERGGGALQQQTLQVKGTIGALTVYDTHTSSTSPQSDSPRSPPPSDAAFSFRSRPSPPPSAASIDMSHLSSSPRAQPPPLLPPRMASRVFWKHKPSDLALLSFSFTMQSQPIQPQPTADLHTAEVDGPIQRGYDASLNLRLSSVSAVISDDFFRPLIAYASEGLLRQATDKAAQQARKAIDTIKEDLTSRSFLFKYVVAVDNPLIFSPHTSAKPTRPQRRDRPWSPDSFTTSPSHLSPDDRSPVDASGWSEYLVLDLGRISVYNEFFLSDAEHAVTGHAGLVSKAPLERLHLSLAAVNLLRASKPSSPPPSTQPQLSTQPPHTEVSGPTLPSPAAVRRSASHDALQDLPQDFSVHGDGVFPHSSTPGFATSTASAFAVFIADAGHFWQTCTKRKIVEDMDIQVEVVSPLAQLHFVGVDAVAVHGDISTVHVNVNERLYAFLLSMYKRDIQPLLSLADTADSAAVVSPPLGLDGGSVLIEEQWGVEQVEPHTNGRPGSLQPIDEKEEVQESTAPAPLQPLLPVDTVTVNLCFHEIFIDVRLTPADVDVGEAASHYSASPLDNADPSLPRSSPRPQRFSFLEASSSSSMEDPAPFAHIRASTLQLAAQLTYDRNLSAVTQSEFECSVARLSVQDSRTDCAHPLFRQIVGGHKDDLSHSTARALSKRRATFSTPAPSFSAHSTSSSGILPSPGLHSQSPSVDDNGSFHAPGSTSAAATESPAQSFSHHSRLFPSQILLTPIIPKSPSRSPLPLYHRPSASLQSQAVQAPLPPTILPDLIISGRQSGRELISVSVDFTAPRLVLSPGCLAAALRAADVFSRITDALLLPVAAPAPADPLLIRYSESTQPNRWMSDAPSPTVVQAQVADDVAPLVSPTFPVPQQPLPSMSPYSAMPAPIPIQVQLSVHDPQVWLMADAANEDHSSVPHAAHMTTLSIDRQSTRAHGTPLVHPATHASIRRSLNLPDWPVDASPVSAAFSSGEEGLDEEQGEEEEDEDDAGTATSNVRREKQHHTHARSGPKSLSCLVLKCQVKVDATIRGEDVQASIDVTELQALVCYRAHHLRLALLSLPPVPIFEPLHLHVDYTAEEDKAAPAAASSPPLPIEHIVINLSTVDACFSFLQISTAASILHGLDRELPPDFFFSSSPPPPPPSSSAFADASFTVPVAPPTFKGSVQLHTAGVELAIVNDAPGYYVPLLRFSLPTLSLSVTEGMPPNPNDSSASAVSSAIVHPEPAGSSSSFPWPFSSSSSASSPAASPSSRPSAAIAAASAAASTSFAVSLTVAGSVYNSEIQQWESLFEPWSLDVSGDQAHITATSAQVFRLSITPSAIHTLARGVDSFQTHFLPTITSLLASSDRQLSASAPVEHASYASTPPHRSSSYSSPVASSRSGSLFSPAEHSVGDLADAKRPPAPTRAPVAPAPSTDKASYFLVRNDTGTRLQFWSIEDGSVDGPSAGPKRVITLDVGEQRTVEMRQYIGIGNGAGGADASGGRRWLYRSPALGLCVEAGKHSGRWDAWKSIEHVSLGTAEESNKPVTALLSLEEEQKTEESVAGLTVHRLIAQRNPAAPPDHVRQSSVDAVAQLVSSLSSLPPLASPADHLSPSLPPPPSAEVDSAMVPDTWLACRLVSGSDAEGSSAKVLVVSSSLLTVNRTFLDLDVQLLDTARGLILFSTLLGSGQSISLPVLSVPSRQVRLMARPSGEAGAGAGNHWQWSDNGPRLSFLRQSSYRHTTIRCEVAGTGKDSSSPAHSHCFFARLNVFRSIPSPITSVDSFEHSSSISALPVHPSPFSSLYPDDGVYTIAFDPPLAYKNMLGCELDYHVTMREQTEGTDGGSDSLDSMPITLTSSGSLPHKQEVHWYGMDLGISSNCVVLLSIRRASRPSPPHPLQSRAQRALSTSSSSSSLSAYVGDFRDHRFLSESDHRFLSAYRHHWSTEWSEPVIIHSTLPSRRLRTAPSIPMRDKDGHTLHVHLDYSDSSISSLTSSTLSASASSSFSSRTFPFAGAGPGLVTSFVPYWLFNCTGVPLVVGVVGRYSECEMGPGQSEEDIERRAQAMMEREDALHRDLTAEQWFTFADSRRQQEKAKGLQLLLGEDDAAHVAGASFTGWHPALRTRPYEQPPHLLSYPAVQLRLLDDDGDDDDADELRFSSAGTEKNRRACIRLPNTGWSKPFSVDAVGTHGALELEEELPSSHPPRPCRLYEFGVSVSLHPNPRFHRSKTLLIHPRVLFQNLTGHALHYRQVGTTECTVVGMQEQVAVHRYDSTLRSRLSLRFASYGWQWCARRYGVAVDEVGSRFMRMRNHHTHDTAVLRVDTRLVQATFEVTVLVAWEQEDAAAHVRAQHSALPPHLSSPAHRLNSSLLIHRNASAPYFDGGPRTGLSSASTPSPTSPPHYGSQAPSQPLSTAESLYRSSTLQTPPAYTHRQSSVTPPPPLPPSADDDAQMSRAHPSHHSSSSRADAVPYRVENYSLHTLVFYQHDVDDSLGARILPYRSDPLRVG